MGNKTFTKSGSIFDIPVCLDKYLKGFVGLHLKSALFSVTKYYIWFCLLYKDCSKYMSFFKKINTLCAMLYFICSNKMHTFLLYSSYDVTLCLKWVSNNTVTHLRLPGWFQVLGLTIWWEVYEQWNIFFFLLQMDNPVSTSISYIGSQNNATHYSQVSKDSICTGLCSLVSMHCSVWVKGSSFY